MQIPPIKRSLKAGLLVSCPRSSSNKPVRSGRTVPLCDPIFSTALLCISQLGMAVDAAQGLVTQQNCVTRNARHSSTFSASF